MANYIHYGFSLKGVVESELECIFDPMQKANKKKVLLFEMVNFDPITFSFPTDILFVRVGVSSRIKCTSENITRMENFVRACPLKLVFVFRDTEWQKLDFLQEHVVCENEYLRRGWAGISSVRKPSDLKLVPGQSEYYISFLGKHGEYIGNYEPELLALYKKYFDEICKGAKVYIYWRIELILGSDENNETDLAISNFRNIV